MACSRQEVHMVWLVTYAKGELQAPVLDILDAEKSGGRRTWDGHLTAPKRLPLNAAPSAEVFRLVGYPWVVLATDAGRAILEARGGCKFKKAEKFRKGTIPLRHLDPWALHERANQHNWDEGDRIPRQISEALHCDRATASLLFWRAGAGFLQQWASYNEVPSIHREHWFLVQDLERRILAGAFEEGGIWFDPGRDGALYDDLAHKFVRRIPDELRRACGTRPPRSLPPLHCVVEDGDLDAVKRLVAAGASLSEWSAEGTPMDIAISCGHRSVVSFLLSSWDPLPRSVSRSFEASRDLSMVELALGAGLGVETLHQCARSGWLQGVEFLLERGVPPDERLHGSSALGHAAMEGRVEAVRTLLIAGADADEADAHGRFLLADVAQRREVECCRLLLEAGVSADAVQKALPWTAWYSMAGDTGQAGLMDLLLAHGADPSEALRRACSCAYSDCVEVALRHRADVGSSDKWGATALHHLATQGNHARRANAERVQIAERLLATGADPAVKNGNGATPADIARGFGLTELEALLTVLP